MTSRTHARIEALALAFPPTIRTNEDVRREHPERVARATSGLLARALAEEPSDDLAATQWVAAMKPYASDPFLGAVERRILTPGQTAVDLEVEAVTRVLHAAEIGLGEVDLILVNSMFADHPEEGDAAWLCKALGYQGAAWNLSGMCGSGVLGLQIASALIESGLHQRVLVVVCCTYSRTMIPESTLGFMAGDGASACLLSASPDERVFRGWGVVNANETCGIVANELVLDGDGVPTLRTRAERRTGKNLPGLFARYLQRTSDLALAAAEWSAADIDGGICFTATRWYDAFVWPVLGISDPSTVCTFSQYGLISSVSIFANLYHAAAATLFNPGDRLLVYSHGFSGACGAMAMTWQPFALGMPPADSAVRPIIRRRGAVAA